jgi:hypothetical protein
MNRQSKLDAAVTLLIKEHEAGCGDAIHNFIRFYLAWKKLGASKSSYTCRNCGMYRDKDNNCVSCGKKMMGEE